MAFPTDDQGKPPSAGSTVNPALAGLQAAIKQTLMRGQSDPALAQASAIAPPPQTPFPGK